MAVANMNDLMSWAQDSRWYEQLMVVANMNDSMSWAQGFRCYEQLKVVDDMNNLGFMSSSLKMLWTTHG